MKLLTCGAARFTAIFHAIQNRKWRSGSSFFGRPARYCRRPAAARPGWCRHCCRRGRMEWSSTHGAKARVTAGGSHGATATGEGNDDNNVQRDMKWTHGTSDLAMPPRRAQRATCDGTQWRYRKVLPGHRYARCARHAGGGVVSPAMNHRTSDHAVARMQRARRGG